MKRVYPIEDYKKIEPMKLYLKEKNPRDYLYFMLLLYTGKRDSDIRELRVCDVKGLYKLELANKKRKRGPKEQVISDELVDAIAEFVADKADYEYLFASREKGPDGEQVPITYNRAYSMLRELGAVFGEHVTPHVIRKTLGQYILIENNYNPRPVMEILDQRDIYSTMAYIGTGHKQLERQLKSIDYGKIGKLNETLQNRPY